MKKVGLFLALLSCLSIMLFPASNAFAGQSRESKSTASVQTGKLYLTQAQVDALAVSRPKLHAQIMNAVAGHSALRISSITDLQALRALDGQTRHQIKGGSAWAAFIIPVYFVIDYIYFNSTGKHLLAGAGVGDFLACVVAIVTLQPALCKPSSGDAGGGKAPTGSLFIAAPSGSTPR
jgi:hypothetical protein